MGKKNVINFAPTGEKKRRRIPKYVGLIVVLCLLAFLVSVFVILILNDFDISKALGARDADPSAQDGSLLSEKVSETDAGNDIAYEGECRFLVLCSDKDGLLFSQIITARPSQGQVEVMPLSLDYSLNVSGETLTLADAFKTASLTSLCEAFRENNLNIDRYVSVSEDDLRILLGKMGSVSVTFDKPREFSIDAVKYSYPEGTQVMTSDSMMKYLKYAGEGEDALAAQALITVSVFRQHFTLANFEKGESFFSSLINLVDSNINAFDYGSAKDTLTGMLSGALEIYAVV